MFHCQNANYWAFGTLQELNWLVEMQWISLEHPMLASLVMEI